MMKFLQAHSAQYEMVGLCMGEQGIISRLLGVRAGSVFTFGSVTRGEETAPGQVAARELRTFTASIRWMRPRRFMALRAIQYRIRFRR